MRRRIALQLRKRSRVQHFMRNQGKRLHGFAIALGVRTACPPCARVPRVAFAVCRTLRESLIDLTPSTSARAGRPDPGLHRSAIAMRVVDEKVTRGVFQV
jgi:hypothetical protein